MQLLPLQLYNQALKCFLQGSLETQPVVLGRRNPTPTEVGLPPTWSNLNQEIFFPNTKAGFLKILNQKNARVIPSSAHQLFWFHMTTEKSTVKAGAVIYTHTRHRM